MFADIENTTASHETRKTRRRSRTSQLSVREREILSLLADGLSGAEIAGRLVVSPETVRTHIRNAMAKLGASTRSQAVALAMQREDIDAERGRDRGESHRRAAGANGHGRGKSADLDRALERMLAKLCELPDVVGGLVFLSEEDGMALRRAAVAGDELAALDIPRRLALGEGPLGRVALNRRATLLSGLTPAAPPNGTVLATPITVEGRLLGTLAVATRYSRPAGHSELLVLQAFGSRVGEILQGGGDPKERLPKTVERFAASWSAAIA